MTSRLAASPSGPVGDHSCQAAISADARSVGPLEVERGGRGLGQRAEREARDHAEAPGARAAQRPEQVLVALLVALHHPPVGQHHLCRDHLVRCEPPAAAQQAKPAAECLAADPDRGAAAGRDRDFVLGQGGVEVAEPEAGSHGGQAVRDLQGMHRREVQHHPGARRAPSEVVPSAPHRDLDTRATRERDRLDHVLGRPAQHHGPRAHVVKARDLRPANLVVSRGAGKDDLALQSRRQVPPSSLHGGHVTPPAKPPRAGSP